MGVDRGRDRRLRSGNGVDESGSVRGAEVGGDGWYWAG